MSKKTLQNDEKSTELKLLEKIVSLEKALRGYKDYVGKVFTQDPEHAKIIFITQNLAEILFPLDSKKASEDKDYLDEVMKIRGNFSATLEEFCNDYLNKIINDKEFKEEVLR